MISVKGPVESCLGGGGARGQYLEHLCTMLRCCVSFSSTVKPRTVKPYIRLLLDVPTWHPHWPTDLDLYFMLQ